MASMIWPQRLVPNSVSWRIHDSTASFASPVTGYTRTSATFGVRRLGLSMEFKGMSQGRRRQMVALLSSLRGKANRIYIPDFTGKDKAGTLNAELYADSELTGINPFTQSCSVTANDGVLRMAVTSTTPTPYFGSGAGISLTAGAAYVLRAYHGNRTNVAATTGITLESTNVDAVNQTGLVSALLTSATGGLTNVFAGRYHTGVAVGDWLDVHFASLVRVALVNGAGQTGSKLTVDNLPASANGLALAGTVAQIGNQPVILTNQLDSNATGQGTLFFEPGLRASPADNSAVIFYKPVGLFMLADEAIEWVNEPGIFSSFSLNFVEVI